MKKKILLVAVIVICLSVLASGTLAYFTTEATARNVITTGYVDIDVIEKHMNGEGELEEFPTDGISGIMPGTAVSKIVSVKNNGAEAWIRVSVEKVVTAADGSVLPADQVTFQVDETKWLEKDGYFYYRLPVATGESTDTLFDEVLFAAAMGNEYQGCKAEIVVSAEAVQVANNGTTVEEAAGWPASGVLVD